MLVVEMPRNRRQTPRDHRVNEVVTAARELFLTQGFNKTPMSQVAETLGVANAAVYWYFKTKDELLAEVWNRSLDEEIERLRNGPEDPFARLIQGLIDLRTYRQLHMTIHERMLNSEAVSAVHERLLDWVRDTVREGIAFHGGDPAVEEDLVELVVVVYEGTNVPGVRTRTATDLVSTILQRVRLQQGTTLGVPPIDPSSLNP